MKDYRQWLRSEYCLKRMLSRKKRKKVIDKMAAVIILQSYLDQK